MKKYLNLVCASVVMFIMTGCVKLMADEVEDLEYDHRSAPGRSAKAILSAKRFTELHIEIQYMKGFKPQDEAIDELQTFLKQFIHKPGGLSFSLEEIPVQADSVLTTEGVKKIEENYRKHYSQGDRLATYVLITDGLYTNNRLLGLAYQNTSVVLFGKHIARNSDRFKKPGRSDLESRVLQHEFGHLLGLVNLGADQIEEHQDAEHGNHCTNRSCLMYYLTDTDGYPSVLLKKDPPKLDKNCMADLRALRDN